MSSAGPSATPRRLAILARVRRFAGVFGAASRRNAKASAPTARRRPPYVAAQRLLAAVLVAVGVAALAFIAVREHGGGRCRSTADCITGLPDDATLVATRSAGAVDATLRAAADGSVSLVALDGERRWRVATDSTAPPRIVAAGDVSGDGTTDYVLALTHPRGPAQRCGTGTAAGTSLLVVDGRSGRTASPFGALRDICWNTPTFNYPTQQWDPGTVYIGDFTSAYRGAEVVVVPYYATRGSVWNLAQSGRWQRVRHGAATSFPFPSTDAFDRVYDATNPAPCSHPAPGGPCYVPHSHVANGVFLPGGVGGLFVLTSARAVVYRPDLTPTSDLTWWPGGQPGNGGRNYGLVEAYRAGGATYVDLVGGCSVLFRWRAMAPGAPASGGNDTCGIVRHFERFQLSGRQISRHQSVYYGYTGREGLLEGRVEYPGHPRAALGGPTTSWTAFNVLRSGSWSAQVFPGPMSTQPIALSGWYVWDTVALPDGGAGLLASRIAAGSMVPSRAFDLLRWDGSRFVSTQHVAGAVPAIMPYAPTPSLHSSETSRLATYVRTDARTGRLALLVTEPSGARRFVALRGGGAAVSR